jgi:hypothetical protein
MSSPAAAPDDKVPISLLSGFLGSGKTTLLQELLHNKGGLKVGVVVNDVASINIDAKLVRDRSSSGIRTKSGEGVEFVELENGCACCNASDELMGCINQLLEVLCTQRPCNPTSRFFRHTVAIHRIMAHNPALSDVARCGGGARWGIQVRPDRDRDERRGRAQERPPRVPGLSPTQHCRPDLVISASLVETIRSIGTFYRTVARILATD